MNILAKNLHFIVYINTKIIFSAGKHQLNQQVFMTLKKGVASKWDLSIQYIYFYM